MTQLAAIPTVGWSALPLHFGATTVGLDWWLRLESWVVLAFIMRAEKLGMVNL